VFLLFFAPCSDVANIAVNIYPRNHKSSLQLSALCFA